jgi:hypothetical protein
MPRRDDHQDDYDDSPSRRRNAPFPTGVKIAGIIWIAFGVLGIIGALINFAVSMGNAAAGAGAAGGPGAGPPPGSNVCSLGCGMLIPIVFLMVGIQTVKGTAKGVLGNAIGSIVFGLLYAGLAVLFVIVGGRMAVIPQEMVLVIVAMCGLLGTALLIAGGLAIVGRDAYTQWRVEQGLARGPRRTVEQDDYEDDRPRRRRRDDDDDR